MLQLLAAEGLLWLSLYVLNRYNRHDDESKRARKAQTNQLQLPRVAEGTPIPVVIGRCRVNSPILAWRGPLNGPYADDYFGDPSLPVWFMNQFYVLGLPMTQDQFDYLPCKLHAVYVDDKKLESFGYEPYAEYYATGSPNSAPFPVSGGQWVYVIQDINNEKVIGTITFFDGKGMASYDPLHGVGGARVTQVLNHSINFGITRAGDANFTRAAFSMMLATGGGGDVVQSIQPSYRNVMSVSLTPISDGTYTKGGNAWQLGSSPNLRSIGFDVSSYGPGVFSNTGTPFYLPTSVGNDANPVEAIYDLLTSTWGRLGWLAAMIDTASWQACANTLATELHGYSRVFYDREDAARVIGDILKQADGVIYVEPTSGKLKMKLVRADYDPTTVQQFSEALGNIVEVVDYPLGSWRETYNRVVVTFTNRSKDYKDDTVAAEDLANVVSQDGRLRTLELAFPGITTETLAGAVATRELNNVSRPLSRIKLKVTRDGVQVRPGDAIRVNYAEYNIVNVVFRVGAIDLGELASNVITIDAVEDVFDNAGTGYVAPAATVTPTSVLVPLTKRVYTEAPYWLMKQLEIMGNISSADVQRIWALHRQEGIANTSFEKTQQAYFLASVYLSDTTLDTFPRAARVQTAYSKTAAPYDTATGLRVYDISAAIVGTFGGIGSTVTTLISQAGANLILVGSEVMAYEGFTDLTGGIFQLNNVWRALFDTVAVDHTVDEKVFWIGPYADKGRSRVGRKGWTLGTVVSGKPTPVYAGSGTGADPVETLTIVDRGKKPYRAADMVVRGRTNEIIGTSGIPALAAVAPWQGAYKAVSAVEGDIRVDAKTRSRIATYITRGDAAAEAITETGTFRFDYVATKVGDAEVTMLADQTLATASNLLLGKAGHGVIDVGVRSKNGASTNWQTPTVRTVAPRWRNLLACPHFETDWASVWTIGTAANRFAAVTAAAQSAIGGGHIGAFTDPPAVSSSSIEQTVDVSGFLARGMSATLDFHYQSTGTNLGAYLPVYGMIEALDASNVSLGSVSSGALNGLDLIWHHGYLTYSSLPLNTAKLRVVLSLSENSSGDSRVADISLRLGQQSANLIANPGFDVDLTGWGTVVSAMSRSTTNVYIGAGNLNSGLGTTDAYYDVTITDGWQYGTAVLYYAVCAEDIVGNNCTVQIQVLDAGGATVLAYVQNTEVVPTGGVYQLRRLSIDLPDLAGKLRVYVQAVGPTGVNPKLHFDDFDLRIHKHLDGVGDVNETPSALAGWTMTKLLADAWNGSAASVNSIWGDGYVECIATETTGYRAIGLQATLTPDPNLDAVGFAQYLWYFQPSGVAIVFGLWADTYATGDVFRVERAGTVVKFLKNGVLRYTHGTASVGPLAVSAVHYSLSSTLASIKLYDAGTQVQLAWRNVVAVSAIQSSSFALDFTTGPSIQKLPATWQAFHLDFPDIGVIYPGDIPIVFGAAYTTPSMPTTASSTAQYAAAWSDSSVHVASKVYVQGYGSLEAGLATSAAVDTYRFTRGLATKNVVASDTASIAGLGAYTSLTAFTVVGFFKIDERGFAAACGLLGRRSATRGWDIDITAGGSLQATLLGASGSKQAARPATSIVTDGAVHMAAITYDPVTTKLRCYDERGFTEISTSAGLGEFAETGSTPFRIGRGRTTIDTIPGDVARVWMFDRALTPTEISRLWGLGRDPTNRIAAHYRGAMPQNATQVRQMLGGRGTFNGGYLFDETSGNPVAAFGTPTPLTAASTPAYWLAGPLGGNDKAVGLDSSADAFSFGNVYNLAATDDVVFVWTGKHAASSATGIVFGKYDGGTTNGYYATLDGAGNLYWRVVIAAVNYDSVVAVPIGVPYVGICVVERATGKTRLATCTISTLAVALGASTTIPATTSTNVQILAIGASPWLTGTADAQIGSFYVGQGPSAGTGIPANISAAVSAIVQALTVVPAWIHTIDDTNGIALSRVAQDQLPIAYDPLGLNGGSGTGYALATARAHQNLASSHEPTNVSTGWTITKTGNNNVIFDAGASSVQTIAGDGYVEFFAPAVSVASGRCVGLSVSDADQSYSSIGWMIAFDNPNYGVWELGVNKLTAPFSVGDIFRVERVGSTLTYSKNGVVVYTSLATSSAALMVDTSFFQVGSSVAGIRLVSAGVPVSMSWQNVAGVTLTAPWLPEGQATFTAGIADCTGILRGVQVICPATNESLGDVDDAFRVEGWFDDLEDEGHFEAVDVAPSGLGWYDIPVSSDGYISLVFFARSVAVAGVALEVTLFDANNKFVARQNKTLGSTWGRYSVGFSGWTGATTTARIRITPVDGLAATFEMCHVYWVGQDATNSPWPTIIFDALATGQSYATVEQSTPAQFNAEGEIDVEGFSYENLPTGSNAAIVSHGNITGLANMRELYATSTGIPQLAHYDGSAVNVTSGNVINGWNTIWRHRCRWSRAGLLDYDGGSGGGKFAGIYSVGGVTDDHYGRTAIWTNGTYPSSRLYIGASGVNGQKSGANALIRKVTLRSAAPKLV